MATQTAEELYERGVSLDDSQVSQSRALFEKAAKMGHTKACAAMGIFCTMGFGGDKDYIEGVRWLTLAAEAGHVIAQYNLGYCYERGIGVIQDEADAVRWYILAAKAGDPAAQSALGICYEYGMGIEKNRPEAIKWLRSAALGGNAEAHYELALFYIQGKGVEKNDTTAKALMAAAARQGHEDAFYHMDYFKEHRNWCYSIRREQGTFLMSDCPDCRRAKVSEENGVYVYRSPCDKDHDYADARDAGYGGVDDE